MLYYQIIMCAFWWSNSQMEYEVSLKHCRLVWSVCLAIFSVIQSYIPNYRTTSDEGTYVLLTRKFYRYTFAVCDV